MNRGPLTHNNQAGEQLFIQTSQSGEYIRKKILGRPCLYE